MSQSQSQSTLIMKRNLQQQEEDFSGTDFMMGVTLLTHPQYISPPRSIMFTNNTKQKVVLNNPEFPLVFTNYENAIGGMGSGRVKSKSDREITHIIPRYNTEGLEKHKYTMFLYDEEKDKYYVVDKKNVEDLTEKFGYAYNTDNMDSKKVGDSFEKDEVMYQSVSYDEYGNYRYGLNATFMYLISNDTIEDAMVFRRGFAEKATSKEVETVEISLNDNDFLKNIFGDDEVYKGFPDIGESTKNVLCARGRFQTRQLLHDAKNENIRRVDANSDKIFFCKGRVTDVTIYCNKTLEELNDNRINSQLIKYIKMQNEYYERILEVTTEILESGSKYSSDITHLYQRAKDILDPEVKWKEDQEKAFSNMVLEITVERDVGIEVGSKGTGRGGNKGVVSVVRDDEDMPILENGKRVDIILNTLGVVNRLSSMQIYEQSITFIMNRTAERMLILHNEGKTQEALKLMVRMINYFNARQAEEMAAFIDKLSPEQIDQMINEASVHGINIHLPPIDWEVNLFDVLEKVYAEETWIEFYDVYVKKFGRYIKMQSKLVVGNMYYMKLKQTATKGLSARSTGKVSSKGLPTKSKRDNSELFSKTPIRIGGDENNNMNIGEDSEMINMLHMYYRSSVHGRKLLATLLGTKVKNITAEDLTDEMISNRNVEILNAYNKILTLRMQFYYPEKTMYFIDKRNQKLQKLKDGSFIMGTDEEALKANIRIDVVEDIKEGQFLKFIPGADYEATVNIEVNKRYEENIKRLRGEN